MTIRWLSPAAENLDLIYNFYYQLYPIYAQELYEQIIKGINTLLHFSFNGIGRNITLSGTPTISFSTYKEKLQDHILYKRSNNLYCRYLGLSSRPGNSIKKNHR